jgi:hypothetical protein
MAGIRIQHPTAKDCRFNIVENDRPYPSGPQQCTPPEFGGCGSVHMFKTHHLNIDSFGACIVGDILYEKIKLHLYAAGFRETNVVDKPPTIGIGLGQREPGTGAWGNIPIIRPDGDQ